MNNSQDNPRLILASKSPRRSYLLDQAGLTFKVIPSSFDENSVSLSTPETYVKTLAEAKTADVSKAYPESWVIGADTIVVIDGTILGKPDSKKQARTMLKSLSGKTHQVYTGYCICCLAKEKVFLDSVKTKPAPMLFRVLAPLLLKASKVLTPMLWDFRFVKLLNFLSKKALQV
jgi:septum formation protein